MVERVMTDSKIVHFETSYLFHLKLIADIEETSFSNGWTEHDLKRLQQYDYSFVGYRNNDRIVGYCAFKITRTYIFMPSIAVIPEFRNRGIGTRLLHEVFKIANDLNLEVGAIARNNTRDSIEFFRKNGFKLIKFDISKIQIGDTKHLSGAYLRYKAHKYHWSNRILNYMPSA